MERSGQTVYFIRPEGRAHQAAIRESIQFKTGLTISISAEVLITKKVLEKLFPDLPLFVQEMAGAFLVGQRCEMGIVVGNNAVDKLRKICGVSENPTECTPESVRRRFASKIPIRAGKGFYWRNAIYYSKDTQDALRDLIIARKLFRGEAVV